MEVEDSGGSNNKSVHLRSGTENEKQSARARYQHRLREAGVDMTLGVATSVTRLNTRAVAAGKASSGVYQALLIQLLLWTNFRDS